MRPLHILTCISKQVRTLRLSLLSGGSYVGFVMHLRVFTYLDFAFILYYVEEMLLEKQNTLFDSVILDYHQIKTCIRIRFISIKCDAFLFFPSVEGGSNFICKKMHHEFVTFLSKTRF